MIEIIEIPLSRLDEYESVPIAFEVRTILVPDLAQSGLEGIHFHEQPVSPYIKDYDQFGPPSSWGDEFDLKNWGIFLAMDGDSPVGGAVVAWNTNGVNMLEGRRDMSVLWDIRVSPRRRGQGVGKMLFDHAAAWSRSKYCTQMKIETQNVNINACRFYEARGAVLGDIRRFAYSQDVHVKDEIQLNWYLDL
jgi:GNAT superfamily N-acetyltransferase